MNVRPTLLLSLLMVALPMAVLAQTPPPPAPSPTPWVAPTPPSDAVVLGWARQWLRYMEIGNIEDRSQLDDSMNSFMSQDTVMRIQGQMNALGTPIAVTLVRKSETNGFTEYDFRLRFDNGTWIEALTLDTDNKIAGLRFYPGQ